MLAAPETHGAYGAPHMADFAVDEIDATDYAPAVEQVRDLGYEPGEIDHVVMTHLHLDHAGNVSEFPDAEFVVQQDELEYAWWPADPIQRKLYLEGDFGVSRSPDFDVRAIDGRVDLFGDGTIEAELQPPFAWDTEEAIRSTRGIRELVRRENADLYLAHDRDHIEAMPEPPATME